MIFLRFCQIEFVCFDVAMSDLVHDVECVFCRGYLIMESGNLILNMSDGQKSAICSFIGITYISEKKNQKLL